MPIFSSKTIFWEAPHLTYFSGIADRIARSALFASSVRLPDLLVRSLDLVGCVRRPSILMKNQNQQSAPRAPTSSSNWCVTLSLTHPTGLFQLIWCNRFSRFLLLKHRIKMFQLDPSIAGRKRPYYCRCSLITFFLPCFYLPFQFFLARNPSI